MFNVPTSRQLSIAQWRAPEQERTVFLLLFALFSACILVFSHTPALLAEELACIATSQGCPTPTAGNDSAVTQINTPVDVNVLENDSGNGFMLNATTVDLDPLMAGQQITFIVVGQGTFAVDSGPQAATASTRLIGQGMVTFTPDNDFTGTVTISYTVDDEYGQTSNQASISVRVNAPPVAVDDSKVTQVDTPVTLNVVSNDSDSDGTVDAVTIDLDPATPGQQSTAIIAGQGTFTVNLGRTVAAASTNDPGTVTVTFTPETDFIGTATVSYTVDDNDGGTSNQATISVRVNAPPVAVDDSKVTQVDTPVTLNFVNNDSDSDGTVDAATIDVDPATPGQQIMAIVAGQGTFTVNYGQTVAAASTNAPVVVTVTFTPEIDFIGTATVSYTVDDNDGGTSNQATISVRVNAPPVAVDDSAITQINTPVDLHILSNDNDSDGSVSVYSVDLDPATPGQQMTHVVDGQGTFSFPPPDVTAAGVRGNIVTFTPATDFTGTATASYTVNDDDGAFSNAATITVEVVGLPTLSIEDLTVREDDQSATVTVTLSAATVATVTVDYATSDGSATKITDYVATIGTLTFAPTVTQQIITIALVDDAVIEADESFSVIIGNVQNGVVADGTALVTILDDDQNQPPTIQSNQRFTVAENSLTGTAIGTVVATDSDKGDTLTFAIAGEADVTAAESIAETMGASNFAINATTGELSVAGAQLDYEVRTTYVLTIEVTDDGNPTLSARNAVTVQVTNVNEAPVVNNPPQDQEAQAGEVYSFTLPADTFSEQDLGDTLTFTATLEGGSPLPAWLTFNSSTRTFSGTPPADASGTITVQVTATDTNGITASDTFTIAVGLNPTNLNAEEEPVQRSYTVFLPTVAR